MPKKKTTKAKAVSDSKVVEAIEEEVMEEFETIDCKITWQSDWWLIYSKIPIIMWLVWAVWKTQKNVAQKYDFRWIDQVQNALNRIMAKERVCVIPNVLERERREVIREKEWKGTKTKSILFYTFLEIEYKIFAEDWSYVTAIMHWEAMDSWDKSTNKAMSAALKYLLLQVFMIPTEETIDPDADSYEGISSLANEFIAEVNWAKDRDSLLKIWAKIKEKKNEIDPRGLTLLQKTFAEKTKNLNS